MGNTQSAGHHNRLSKPKTNTNSAFGSPKADSPVSVSSKYADFSTKDRYQLKTQLTSPVDTDFSFSTNGDDKLGDLARNIQRRLSTLSRSNSVASHTKGSQGSKAKLASLPGSRLSLVSQSQGVDLGTAIKIIQEVSKTASPEDLAALRKLRSSLFIMHNHSCVTLVDIDVSRPSTPEYYPVSFAFSK
jgi:hypothetical protein